LFIKRILLASSNSTGEVCGNTRKHTTEDGCVLCKNDGCRVDLVNSRRIYL